MNKTKNKIKNTVINLLYKKPIEKITVKEITNRLEINRSTFYAYYQNLYNVIDEIEFEILNNIKKTIKENSDFKEILIKTISYVKDNKKIFNILLNSPYFNLKNKLFNVLQNEFINTNSKYISDDPLKTKYNSYFYLTGCIGIVSAWLNDDCIYPVSKIHECIFSVFNIDEI